jgi:hypothetical protein
LWQPYYSTIFQIGERDLMLIEETSGDFIYIPDFNAIIQFELSNSFRQYQPHFHYTVTGVIVNPDDHNQNQHDQKDGVIELPLQSDT